MTAIIRRTGTRLPFLDVHIGNPFWAHGRLWVRTDGDAATQLVSVGEHGLAANFLIDGTVHSSRRHGFPNNDLCEEVESATVEIAEEGHPVVASNTAVVRLLTIARGFLTDDQLEEMLASMEGAMVSIESSKSVLQTMSALRAEHAQRRVLGEQPDSHGWYPLRTAPLETTGNLYTPELPDRTDITGEVHERADKSRFAVSSSTRGYEFTHWRPSPLPPVCAPELVRRSRPGARARR